MKQKFWSAPWFFIPVLLFFNIGLLLQLYIPAGQEILHLNPWRSEDLNLFFRNATKLGEPLVFLVIGLLSMLWRFRFAVLFALAGLIITPSSYFLKKLVSKDRPITFFEKNGLRDAVQYDPEIYLNRGRTSFPSGHSMAAFGMYGLLAMFFDRKSFIPSLICALLAILVAISRVYLVQHFLPDILAGAFLGLSITALVVWLDQRYFKSIAALNRGLVPAFRRD